MSKCTIKGDAEKIYNLLSHGKIFWDLGSNPTRETSLSSFEYLEQQFAEEAIERKAFKEGETEVLKYVWNLNGKEFVFQRSPSMSSKGRWTRLFKTDTDKFGLFSLSVGTTTHYAFEQLMLKRVGKNNKSKRELLDEINNSEEHANLNMSVINQIESRVNEIYNSAAAHQKRIDPNQDVVVKVEVPVINPSKSLMGTQDLMFVFSDNTVWDFDYKTSILTNDKLDSSRKPKDLIETHTKRNSHTEQMRDYKVAKEAMHGVKVTKSIILPIGVKVNKIKSRANIKADNVNEVTVTEIFTSDDVNSKARQTPSNLYASDIESLATEAQNLHSIMVELQKKSKASRKKKDYQQLQRYSAAIKILDTMNQELIAFRSIDAVYKAMLDILKIMPDNIDAPVMIEVDGEMVENPDVVSNEELLQIQKYLEQLLSFEDVLKDIVQAEYDIKPGKNKRTDPLVKKLDQLRSDILTKMGVEDTNTFDLIEQKLGEVVEVLGKRTRDRIGNNKLTNGKIAMNSLGVWEQYLTVHGEIDNPAMRALGKLNNIAMIRANKNYAARSKQFLDIATKAANHADSLGISQEEMMSMMVDESTGNMINVYSEEFDEALQKALDKKDSKWVKEHHEIIDEAAFKQQLDERRAAFLHVLRKKASWTEADGYPTQLIADDVKKQMYEWELKNNLLKSDAAWLNVKQLNDHTRVKNSEEFYTDAYKKILQYPPIADFFNEYANLWGDMRDVLGVGKGALPENFIPNVKKELIDTVAISDWRNKGSDFMAAIQDLYQSNEVDRVQINREMNNTSYQVPMLYLSPLHNDKGKAIRAKSFDIISSALLFMKMAYNHEALTETMPDAEMILNFLENSDNILQADTGGGTQRKINYFGNTALAKLGIKDSDVYDRAKKMFDYNWLGIRYGNATKWPKLGGTFNPETGEIVGQIDTAKAVLSVRNLNIQSALGFNIISAAGANLGAFGRALIIGREKLAYTREQMLDAARGWTNQEERDKQLLATTYFNTSAEGLQRHQIWNSKGLVKGALKTSNLRKWISSEGLLKFFSGGDAVLANMVTAAMMRNFAYDPATGRVRRIEMIADNENVKSLWEAMQINEETGEVTFDGVPDGKLSEDNEEIFYSAVRLTMKSVTGQLNDQELMGLQETILGTLFTTYRTWLPSIMQSEFGKPKYIEQFEAIKEGRMNTMFKNYYIDYNNVSQDADIRKQLLRIVKGTLDLSADVVKTALFLKSIESEDFLKNDSLIMEFDIWESQYPEKARLMGDTREEKLRKWRDMKYRNVVSGLAMLRTIAHLMTLSTMMLAIDLDEDDEADVLEIYATKQLFRVFNRASGELATPISPGEILSIGDVSIPAVSFFHNTLKSFYNGVKESKDFVTGTEDKRDKTPFFYYGSRNLPGISQLYRILYQAFYTNPAATRDTSPAIWRALGLG